MADLYRLILALGLLLASFTAFAAPPVTQYYYAPLNPQQFRNSAMAACQDWQSFNNSRCGTVETTRILSITAADGPARSCSYTYGPCATGALTGGWTSTVLSARSWCASTDSAPVGGECPDGTPEPPCPAAGQSAGIVRRDSAGVPPAGDWFACEGRASVKGCLVDVAKDFGAQTPTGWVSQGNGRYTGEMCDLDQSGDGSRNDPAPMKFPPGPKVTPVPPGTAVSEPCPRGSYTGQVNGADVCIKPSSTDTVSGTTPGTTTTTDSSGNMTEVKTQQETTCSGNRCTVSTTTTTTVRNAAGVQQSQTTTTGTEDKDRTVYCTANPGLQACGGGAGGGGGGGDDDNGTFSGDCTGSFSCTGDPVLCAAAKAVSSMNCQLQKEPTEIAKYDAAKALTGNRTTELPGNSTTAITSELFNRADPLGGGTGTCITDRTITVMNRSIAVPFSTVCPHLDLLRQMLQAVSYLVAAGIVFRRG